MSSLPSNAFDPSSILNSPAYQQELAAQRSFTVRVFGWMTVGLLVTALIAMTIGLTGLTRKIIPNNGVLIAMLLVQLGIAFGMGFLNHKIPAKVAAALFLLYSAITGVVFSILFLIYTQGSIATTFFITAGMFGTMAVIGYTTKKDLTSLGSLLFMALIGLVIASVVNLFMHSTMMYWLISYGGVIIFTGLTAYDVQKMKQSYAAGEYGSEGFERAAIFWAFELYLDFINLFIYLLRILGTRKD